MTRPCVCPDGQGRFGRVAGAKFALLHRAAHCNVQHLLGWRLSRLERVRKGQYVGPLREVHVAEEVWVIERLVEIPSHPTKAGRVAARIRGLEVVGDALVLHLGRRSQQGFPVLEVYIEPSG